MMWLPVEPVVPPAFEPVSLDDLKAHVRAEGDADDALLEGYLAAAVQHVQNETGLVLAEQTVVVRGSAPWGRYLRLPVAPLQSVVDITYVDSNGADQTLSGDVFAVLAYGLHPRIALKHDQSWPSTRLQDDAISVEAVVGYEEGELPQPLRVAVLMICADWYSRPENTVTGTIVAEMPIAVKALLKPYCRIVL